MKEITNMTEDDTFNVLKKITYNDINRIYIDIFRNSRHLSIPAMMDKIDFEFKKVGWTRDEYYNIRDLREYG